MTVQRLEHVGIVVDDLSAAIEFFVELGLELQGEGSVEGRWVDRVVGLDGIRVDIAFVQTPDGHGRLELVKFHSPPTQGGDRHAPANTPGIRHIAFGVEDIDAVVAGLRARGSSSSASSSATRTATGSATSAAPRGSSSSWRSGSADASGPLSWLIGGNTSRSASRVRKKTPAGMSMDTRKDHERIVVIRVSAPA